MITTYYIIVIAALAIAGITLLTLFIIQRRQSKELGDSLKQTQEAAAKSEAELFSQLHSLQQRLEQERTTREAEQMARVKAETELEAERRSISDKVRSQEELQQSLKEQFRTLAGDVLGEQSRRFKEENRESMDIILKPFKDNISEFRSRVDAIFTQQTEQSGALKNELQRLMELNQQITTETTNLTNALKGNSKVRGDWGEMILESILEGSNLIRGVHYYTQYSTKDEENNDRRPDVVLKLPNDKHIIIDSKVSLPDYINYVNAESESERKTAMERHIASIRKHITGLSSKSYQKLVQSPDFVIMFIPNEPAFLDALKYDNTIWNEAHEKKVIISSPTNLFAILKIVDDLWRRDEQSKNYAQIIEEGVKLYEQLVAFTADLEAVGTNIGKAKDYYDNAYKRLHTGRNNIVRVGERMRKLGLPTTKRQSARLVELSETEAEAEVEAEDKAILELKQ